VVSFPLNLFPNLRVLLRHRLTNVPLKLFVSRLKISCPSTGCGWVPVVSPHFETVFFPTLFPGYSDFTLRAVFDHFTVPFPAFFKFIRLSILISCAQTKAAPLQKPFFFRPAHWTILPVTQAPQCPFFVCLCRFCPRTSSFVISLAPLVYPWAVFTTVFPRS